MMVMISSWHKSARSLLLGAGLALAATGLAQAQSGPNLAGSYSVEGQNAKGGTYRGVATIRRTGETYQIEWTIAKSVYKGTAILDQDALAVGLPSQVVLYRLAPDGRLFGLWSELGDSTVLREVLTPQN